MKSVNLKFFYSPMCSICPDAKNLVRTVVEELGIGSYEEINIHSKDGERKASIYGIESVPSLVINEKKMLSGILRRDVIKETIKEEQSNGDCKKH